MKRIVPAEPGGIATDSEPNNLLKFMLWAAERSKHVLLGTATPVQTDVSELWDLLEVLNRGADHVMGRPGSVWAQPVPAIRILTGERSVLREEEAWDLIRNPLPAKGEGSLFDHIRGDLGIRPDRFTPTVP